MIKAFGIVFRFHPLFVLLMLLSVATGSFAELLTLFALVLIHEIGHVACAKHYGWHVREIQLLPFGGVAVVDEGSSVPAREELLVALAGPLQNVWMIAFAMLMKACGVADPAWWDYFLQANAMLALFNLLPVQPLDGGKVMLCLLSYMFSYHKAMVWCGRISLFMSVLMIIASLLPIASGGIGLNTLAIGLFLLYSNWYAHKHLSFQFIRFLVGRESRAGRHIKSGALAQPIVVGGEHRIADIMRLFMREKYHLIYVVGGQGNIRKVLPEQELIRSFLTGDGRGYTVFDVFMYNKK